MPSNRVPGSGTHRKVRYSASAAWRSEGDGRAGSSALSSEREVEDVALLRVVEGLHAEPVAGHEELVALGVPDREGEDPVEAVEHLLAVLGVHRQQHLGVAVRLEPKAVRLEVGPQLAEVVQLAVVGDPVALVRVSHRLRPPRARVEDAEAAVAERRGGACAVGAEDLDPVAVGPPMRERLGHRLDQPAIGATHQAADPAHRLSRPPAGRLTGGFGSPRRRVPERTDRMP